MIVEFLEGGGFTLGFVTNIQGARGRMEVLLAGGRSLSISPTRILVTADSEEPSDKWSRRVLLAEIERVREKLAADVDLETLWSVLEGEGPEFTYKDLAGLYYGREVGPDEISALLRAIMGEGLLFEFLPEKARRRDQAEVDKLKKIKNERFEKLNFLARGAEWLSYSEKGLVCPEPEGAEKVIKWLMGYVLEGEEAQYALEAKELLALATLPESPDGAFKALVKVGHFHTHENLSLLRLNLKREFDPEVLEEAELLVKNFNLDQANRLDLTYVPTVTVDALGASEYDDALSLEPLSDGKVRLGLHIADVAAMVPKDSLVDRWAAQQTSSIYLPECRYGMLPDLLVNNLASLKLNQVRPAFSLLAIIDSEGHVLERGFRPTLIKVDLQVSFEEASQTLDRGQSPILSQLESLALKLLRNRLANDGQNLGLPHLNVSLGEDGRPEARLSDDGNRANVMVSELMILGNHLAAKTLMDASVACPFRSQQQSRPITWNPPRELTDRVKLAVALAMRRQTGRSEVSMEPSIHHGLGLMPYTTFTSPMRRFLDLVVGRQLRSLANKTEAPYDYQEMINLAMPTEITQKAIRRTQNQRQRYWLAWLLKNKVGETFLGLVYDRRGRRARLCVTDYMLEVELNNLPPEAKPGTDVLLKLSSVNPAPDLPGEIEDFWKFDYLGLAASDKDDKYLLL
ncbi:MAG: RNB domain-containing ribonuclease [Deltaproteobacteria bacterium]|nr:RNB domain-containing ribonuclease [Deltaproteobacteria bacterium]